MPADSAKGQLVIQIGSDGHFAIGAIIPLFVMEYMVISVQITVDGFGIAPRRAHYSVWLT